MKVLVAGDFCPQNRVSKLFDKGDYSSVLQGVRNLTNKVDYSVVNFECPISEDQSFAIRKVGPNLRCGKSGAEALKWAGFKCATLANNHFYDYGAEGVRNTVEIFEGLGIDTVGGGINIEKASVSLYKQLGAKTLAIVNCCEHEFSIAGNDKGGSNPLNPIRQFSAIREAKAKADIVLVVVHGGHEHYQLPSIRMQETYRFFIDVGADAVVNHHQHCYSGYEIYQGKPIFYGLGNFCFDYPVFAKEHVSWAFGYMVELDFGESLSFRVIPYEQCGKEAVVKILPEDSFNTELTELNKTIANIELLRVAQDNYYNKSMAGILTIFQPFRSRLAFGLRKFKIMPSLMSRRWQLALYNYILCEAHRDKVEYFLEQYNH